MKWIDKIKFKIRCLKFKLYSIKWSIRFKRDINRYIKNDIKITREICRGMCKECGRYNINTDECSMFGKYLHNERVDNCSAYNRKSI